jgi:nitrate reductase NapD
MAIASMIVQPVAGLIRQVTEALTGINGVTVHTVTDKQEIIIVVEAASLDIVSETARHIEGINGVVNVCPSYVTTADEEDC